MSFEINATAQIRRIRENLLKCTQTKNDERATFQQAIDKSVDGKADDDIEIVQVKKAKDAIRNLAETQDLFLRGKINSDWSGISLYSTKTEQSLVAIYVRTLNNMPDITASEAEEIAQQLIYELEDQLIMKDRRDTYRDLPLHYITAPMWLTKPTADSAVFSADIELLPARLGMAPFPGRYVLMGVIARECRIPRFADSGGYPYWRPGGMTQPIAQCPSAKSGLAEAVSEALYLSDLIQPLVRYIRPKE